MPRSQALAAVLLALTPLSAFAAGTDASLTAAFAAQRDALRAVVSAAKAGRAAAPDRSTLSPADWSALVAKIRAVGAYTPSNGDIPATYGLEDVRGPKDAAHLANYINEWGYTDSHGVFQPGEVTLVSEYWSIPADGNWHIDQWLFRLNVDGSISSRAHITLVETRDGQVLGDDAEQLKDGDPRVAAKYDTLLDNWKTFQPRPKLAKASEPISYDGLAKSFDGAPAVASPAALLGEWLEVAIAASPSEPGQYDPNGFSDRWNPNHPEGVAFRMIPAKPPIQNEDSYELAFGVFDPAGKPFSVIETLALVSTTRGTIQNVPGHMEDDPISCTNCGGETTHWEDGRTYEFRAVGDKKDYVIEKETVAGNYDEATQTVKGGTSYYFGFAKRPAK